MDKHFRQNSVKKEASTTINKNIKTSIFSNDDSKTESRSSKIEELKKDFSNFLDDENSSNNPPKDSDKESVASNGLNSSSKLSKGFFARIKKGGIILSALATVALVAGLLTFPTDSVDTSVAAQKALRDRVSQELPIGAQLMSSDHGQIQSDPIVTHNSNDNKTKIWIWDYAAEDGDYVQVLVDGVPLGSPFMIRNAPVSFDVPTVGKVQVQGTRDGGGGITYAVHYEVNHTTYLNGVDIGGTNTYTLIRGNP